MKVKIYPASKEHSLSTYKLFYHYWRFKKYLEIVKHLIKHNDHFLDIGCQEGILLSNLPECHKYGLEMDRKYLVLAKKRIIKGKFSTGIAEKLPYKSNTFDWVSCTEVIEHVENPVRALKEIKRVLRKDGRLLLSTYNHYNIFNIFTGFVLLRKPKLEGHVREYNWLTITRALSVDFDIELKTQAGSCAFTDWFFNLTRLPFGEFMILLCKKKCK